MLGQQAHHRGQVSMGSMTNHGGQAGGAVEAQLTIEGRKEGAGACTWRGGVQGQEADHREQAEGAVAAQLTTDRRRWVQRHTQPERRQGREGQVQHVDLNG